MYKYNGLYGIIIENSPTCQISEHPTFLRHMCISSLVISKKHQVV